MSERLLQKSFMFEIQSKLFFQFVIFRLWHNPYVTFALFARHSRHSCWFYCSLSFHYISFPTLHSQIWNNFVLRSFSRVLWLRLSQPCEGFLLYWRREVHRCRYGECFCPQSRSAGSASPERIVR